MVKEYPWALIAIVAVYGIAWMAETMFGAHMSEIQGVLGEW